MTLSVRLALYRHAQTLNDGSKDLLSLLSVQRQLSLNCLLAQLLIRIRVAEVHNKLSMSTDAPQLFLLQSRMRSAFLHDQLFSAPSDPWALGVAPQRTCRQPCPELHLCNLHDLLDRLHRWYCICASPRSSAQLELLDLPLLHDRDVHHFIDKLRPRYLCSLQHLQAELFINRRGDVEPQEFSNLDSDDEVLTHVKFHALVKLFV